VQAGLDPCWLQTHYVGFVLTWLIYTISGKTSEDVGIVLKCLDVMISKRKRQVHCQTIYYILLNKFPCFLPSFHAHNESYISITVITPFYAKYLEQTWPLLNLDKIIYHFWRKFQNKYIFVSVPTMPSDYGLHSFDG
jgi:hypothetical protein